ncbi:alpha-amylase [Bradyrhizobium sp. LTSP885]|uniref:alpha-amylase family protein n=1 Tax=Bradyrhizobium sp. LTSP885 TaxID=1619232 RepID=UPI0005C920AC|nr:alpha-amylase family protein [Bradyrhizobium sp. LTSP885]KJC35839.1 alpha-amylase [Bradyrhizobium sp. LTSP885]
MTGRASTWIDHALFWQIYPLGFVGAEHSAISDDQVRHRLDHIVDWLDYAVQLGASGLLLGPIFASSTHGYDTIDYFRIDPRLGNEAGFEELVAEARRRGLHVVLDGVFNHVGRDFPAFRAALAKGANSPEAAWFCPLQGTDSSGEPAFATFEGHPGLITLNHDNPEVSEYVIRVMDHWLDRGISGWRLDAAYAMPRRFWATVLAKVKSRHPHAYVFGEVIHGDYAAFVRESGVDAVTQYELWKAIWSALNDRNLFELAWALDRHNRYLETFAPLTFVGNHDVTRLASKLDDERHIAHALAILLTVGGTPCIYAGDEQAFRGIKEHRAGGDDAIRPAFPASAEDLPSDGWSIYRLHQDLIGLRRRHSWLVRACTRIVHLKSRHMVMKLEADGKSLAVALNLDDREAILPAPGAWGLLAGSVSISDAGTSSACAKVPAHGWGVLSLSEGE